MGKKNIFLEKRDALSEHNETYNTELQYKIESSEHKIYICAVSTKKTGSLNPVCTISTHIQSSRHRYSRYISTQRTSGTGSTRNSSAVSTEKCPSETRQEQSSVWGFFCPVGNCNSISPTKVYFFRLIFMRFSSWWPSDCGQCRRFSLFVETLLKVCSNCRLLLKAAILPTTPREVSCRCVTVTDIQ